MHLKGLSHLPKFIIIRVQLSVNIVGYVMCCHKDHFLLMRDVAAAAAFVSLLWCVCLAVKTILLTETTKIIYIFNELLIEPMQVVLSPLS